MDGDPLTPGLLRRLPKPPRKVVLVKPSRIGDFICATPTFRSIRAALPQAEISLITLPMLEELALRLPYFDRIIPFPGYPGLAEQFFDARQANRFFRKMQAEHFDLAIQLQGSGVYSNPFTLMLGARYTAGFIRSGDPPGRLEAALPMPETGHEVQRMLALAGFLGAPETGENTEYPLRPEDEQQAQNLLGAFNLPLIGMHPSARSATRRWSLERFAAAAGSLRQRYRGTIVVLGEEEESQQADELIYQAGGAGLNLAGKTSLPVLGAVIARLSVLVTNDSGPAHIAYALGTPVVTIFGGESLERYGAPYAGPIRILAHPVACRPCNYAECPIGTLCLEEVSVQEVVSAAEGLINLPVKNRKAAVV